MLEGKMVRVRFRRDDPEQPIWVFVGRVVHFSAAWVGVEGKGIMVLKRTTTSQEPRVWKGRSMVQDAPRQSSASPIVADDEMRTLVFPRDCIFNIRLLPDKFDLKNLRVTFDNGRLDLVVDGAPDSSIDDSIED